VDGQGLRSLESRIAGPNRFFRNYARSPKLSTTFLGRPKATMPVCGLFGMDMTAKADALARIVARALFRSD
jgi:hypothetical protein